MCGIPEVFYTDNGSDFTSHHMEQVAADLKMRLLFSTPGKPRGRGRIERFFSSLSQMCLSGLPGYTPPAGGVSGKPTLTLSEIDAHIREFLLTGYHQRVHSETKQTPKDRFAGEGFLPQMASSLEQLDLLLLTTFAGDGDRNDRGENAQGSPGRHPLPRVPLRGRDARRLCRRIASAPL